MIVVDTSVWIGFPRDEESVAVRKLRGAALLHQDRHDFTPMEKHLGLQCL